MKETAVGLRMRSEHNLNFLNICIKIIFFSVIFFVVSAGEDDYSIKISDSLTLHSGDIITLQADDNTYLSSSKSSKYPWWCYNRKCVGVVTEYFDPKDPDSYFIVETAGNNQIRLKDKETERYLEYYKYRGNSAGLNYPDGWGAVGLKERQLLRPYIRIEGTRPTKENLFTIKVDTTEGDKIALKAFNGKYLKRLHTKIPKPLLGKGEPKEINLITVESDGSDEHCFFTVTRTGLHPDFVQSVSNVTFDLEKLDFYTKPSVIVRFEPQENTGNSERHFIFEEEHTTKVINKWTLEKGTELTIGAKITANLEKQISAEIPIKGISIGIAKTIGFGAEMSMEIKNSATETNEYTDEREHKIKWTEDIPIPPHTRVSAEIIASEAQIDVPFSATVTAKSKKTGLTYSYPINGSYQGTRTVNIRVNVTEEPLDQTSIIKPNVSKPANNRTVSTGCYCGF